MEGMHKIPKKLIRDKVSAPPPPPHHFWPKDEKRSNPTRFGAGFGLYDLGPKIHCTTYLTKRIIPNDCCHLSIQITYYIYGAME